MGRGEKSSAFSADWRYFKMQFNHIDINLYNTPGDLHDRYIITNNSVIFLGHGIKDFGARESFIIIFEKGAGKNILADLNKQFDDRWRNSTPVI